MKKKILMVHNFYQIGGGEHTVFQNEIELLRENGHEVVEYTRSNDELKTSMLKLLLLPFTTAWSWKTYRDIRRIIKSEKIDIVHCHNTFPLISPSVYYAARSMKIPVVQTIHNFRFLCPNGSFFRNGKICEECSQQWNFKNAIKNKCYRNSMIETIVLAAMLKIHRILGTYKNISYIFTDDFIKDKFSRLIDINSDQVFVKPNFYDSQYNADSDMQCQHRSKYFTFVGRLEDNKGILTLISLWKELPKDYELHIFGDGSYREAVVKAEKEMTNVSYFGFQPQSVVFEDTRNCCAVIISSEWYETFGMSVPESFSMGVPVISTDFGTPAKLISESNGGLIYKNDDCKSLKKCLDEVYCNRKYFSANAVSYYRENLSGAANYRKIVEIYDKARAF